jgi:hypothetical protein
MIHHSSLFSLASDYEEAKNHHPFAVYVSFTIYVGKGICFCLNRGRFHKTLIHRHRRVYFRRKITFCNQEKRLGERKMTKLATTLLIISVVLSACLVFAPRVTVLGSDGVGKALSFDGVSSYVSVLPIDESTYTFELWFKPETNFALIGSGRFLIQTGDDSLTVWYDVYTAPLQWYPHIGTMSWHHLAVVIDYTAWEITPYLDGSSLGMKPTPTQTEPNPMTNVTIGSYYYGDRFFSGTIDEVRIYNRTLTAAEVSAHYNLGIGQYGRPEPGLVAGWHFDEGSGTIAHDYSGNGNDGTIYGAIYVDGHVPLPDVSIAGVTKSANKVISGDTVAINVTAQNLGTPFEDFTVTAYYDDTPIGSIPVTGLAPAATANLTFSWNTLGVPLGTYTIKANASIVQGETNIANNQVTDGTVWIAQYPIASFTYSPVPPIENSSTTFDASSSNSRGGSIVNYTWTFDDGNVTTTTIPVITHVYALKGTYNVVLKIWDSEDLSNSTSQPVNVLRHDVAITDVTPYRNWVYQGWSASINVTIKNNGDFDETVAVTVYYNITGGGIVGTQTVSLLVGQNKTITFTWNTTGVPCCHNYTMTAVASIPVDTVPADNTLADGNIKVRLMFDVNGDDKIDGKDISMAALAFGTVPGDPRWNPDVDLNQDGKNDGKDLTLVAGHFGSSGSP